MNVKSPVLLKTTLSVAVAFFSTFDSAKAMPPPDTAFPEETREAEVGFTLKYGGSESENEEFKRAFQIA